MDCHIDPALTSSFLRQGFQIRAFLKSEFYEDFKNDHDFSFRRF